MPDIIVEHQGVLYTAVRYSKRDVWDANMAYNAREITQPEYDQRERARAKQVHDYYEAGIYKLIPRTEGTNGN